LGHSECLGFKPDSPTRFSEEPLFGGWPQVSFKHKNLFGLGIYEGHATFRKGKLHHYHICWQVPNKSAHLYYSILRDYLIKLYPGVKVQQLDDSEGSVTWWNATVSLQQREKIGMFRQCEPDTMSLSKTNCDSALCETVHLYVFAGKEKRTMKNLAGVSDWWETPQILLDTNQEKNPS